MDISQIEKNVQKVTDNLSEETFIFDLLTAYGLPKASITRLQKGDYNLSKAEGGILWKKKLLFQVEKSSDLHELIDSLQSDAAVAKQHPRFVIVTDYRTILAVDTKLQDTLDIPIKELPRHFDFLLPWAGMEKAQVQGENPADIKAAERMGQLYDLILQNNPIKNDADRHSLNIFFSRLLFCFFAEDTGIFPQDKFTNGLASHTREDGSDLKDYLSKLFHVLSTEERSHYPKFLQEFPYVNGGLFCDEHPVPEFATKSRKIMIECGSLNWKAINPDIFGSMMQAVVHTDQRSGMGMHYTSVVNIMKMIEPLFLNALLDELEKAGSDTKKLQSLLARIYNLRVFDPACGSGNFLIIAYKELCRLEIEIFKKLHGGQTSFRFQSKLQLTQFYGIEIDDFAHETAKLSLWLAEHQMNVAFREVFGEARPTLPLQDGGNIICANATRISWEEVCPNDNGHEVYILGNPPFVGDKLQSPEQKADLAQIFRGIKNSKAVDYVAAWFMKASDYIKSNGAFAFVATNSICQGIQVPLLWPHLFKKGLEIGFAHTSFPWTNNAKNNAKVICCIVGMRRVSGAPKYIYSLDARGHVKNINAYLIDGPNIIVQKHSQPISDLPSMLAGNIPRDEGNLMFSDDQKKELVRAYPQAVTLFRQIMGSKDFINGILRWCLWITDEDADLAWSIPVIAEKLEKIKHYRSTGSERGKLGIDTPYKFERTITCRESQIIVPRVSSQRRNYIPVGFLNPEVIISDSAQAIYDPDPFVFSLISSRMHMTWIRVTAGRMKSDFRYSSGVCYNSFPVPTLSSKQKVNLEEYLFRILDEREKHSEKTMAELYDPDVMPAGLKEAHCELDEVVEGLYRSKPFKDNQERLKYLFALYQQMTTGQSVQEELYA